MNQLRIFLIGAGHIARAHSVTAQKLAEIYNLNLEIYVADPFEAARTSFSEQFPDAKTYATPEELLAIPATENDIAIVATPPFLHREGALWALGSGRHTLVEKPLALNENEALEIHAAALAAGKHWGECSMRLHDQPNTRALRERILSGEIGVPYRVNHVWKGGWGRPGIEYQPQSKWFMDKSKAGGGILVDWGVYDLANLTFLLRPTKIEIRDAWKAQPQTPADPTDVPFDVETHAGAAMVWHLPDGGKIHVNYERASGTHAKEERFSEIVGTQGSFSWDWAWGSSGPAVKRAYSEGETVEEELKFVDEWEEKWEVDQGQRPLITFYKKAIRGEEVPALMDEAALFNFRVLCALFQASETGEVLTIEA
ncbi:MAG TPA: Gfo/Idh/MocA family oxidoreductase [Abditibacterium sp.]|jgi:predicted dehydrogenase